jgi:hypothetical protein
LQRGKIASFAPPRIGEPPRRYNLEIAPGMPFIEGDKTFDLPGGQNLSFRLTFQMFYDMYQTQAIFGILAFANDETGTRQKLKSDRLFLVSPSYSTAASFNENQKTMTEALMVNRYKQCYLSFDSGKEVERCEWEQSVRSMDGQIPFVSKG